MRLFLTDKILKNAGVRMNFKNIIKDSIINIQDRHIIRVRRNYETNKFKDIRRENIFKTIELTEDNKKQIDDLYISNYGERVPYTWHRHYTAFTGRFDAAYFPELLYIPEFEYFMNEKRQYQDVFDNKNVLAMIAGGVGVKMPKTIFSAANGILRDSEYNITDLSTIRKNLTRGVYFAKPAVETGSGKGCFLLNSDSDSFKKEIQTLGKDFVIQERISCSKSISMLYPRSVNTFRIMTYIWDNRIEIVPVVLRIGQGNAFLDNAHAGGMFIAVNNDGTLHKKAFTEFKDEFAVHPDSHIRFDGYKIDNLSKVIKSAKRMHSAIPQLGVINWDFTIGEDEEPILIEANTSAGGIWIFQMAWGCGPFGKRTAEILRWIREQKNTPKNKRR